jgi:PTS system mannose-specific IIB component
MAQVDFPGLARDDSRTFLLLRDLGAVASALELGLPLNHLNLGNIHYGSGRRQVSASVFLSEPELSQLANLAEHGTEVEARGVPSDRPVTMPEITERFSKGAP